MTESDKTFKTHPKVELVDIRNLVNWLIICFNVYTSGRDANFLGYWKKPLEYIGRFLSKL
jgi:hypothetical protein